MKQIVIIEATNEEDLETDVNAQLASLLNAVVVGFAYSPTGYHVIIQYDVP